MDEKVCSSCNETKPVSEFGPNKQTRDGLRSWCNACRSRNEYYSDVEGQRQKRRDQYQKHREAYSERMSRYYEKNKDRIKQRAKESLYEKRKDPRFRASERISRGILAALKKGKNGYHWENLVGYTREDLVSHLEALFQPGMTWDNYGEWHIDHVVPKSHFEYNSYDDEAFKECWALKNLQPLWAKDNLRKHARIVGMG